jgi:CRISPR/Cas system-associated endonuclease Cas1
MNKARSARILLEDRGSYLGMEKGCFILRDKEGKEQKYPLFENELKEVVLRSGGTVSTGTFTSLSFWGVDVVLATARGRPVAVIKGLEDDSHVKTRLCQYEAYARGLFSSLLGYKKRQDT